MNMHETFDTIPELLADALMRAKDMESVAIAWTTKSGEITTAAFSDSKLVALGLASRLVNYIQCGIDESMDDDADEEDEESETAT